MRRAATGTEGLHAAPWPPEEVTPLPKLKFNPNSTLHTLKLSDACPTNSRFHYHCPLCCVLLNLSQLCLALLYSGDPLPSKCRRQLQDSNKIPETWVLLHALSQGRLLFTCMQCVYGQVRHNLEENSRL